MAPNWQTGEGGFGLRCGSLSVSFQRFEAPANGVLSGLPRSLGQLPLAREDTDCFVLPVGVGEAVWIGLSVSAGQSWGLSVTALLTNGLMRPVCEPKAKVAPILHLAGIPISENRWLVLGRCDCGDAPGLASLLVTAASGSSRAGAAPLTVRFVSFSEARRLAPQLRIPPLDRKAGYRGYRLP